MKLSDLINKSAKILKISEATQHSPSDRVSITLQIANVDDVKITITGYDLMMSARKSSKPKFHVAPAASAKDILKTIKRKRPKS